MGKTASVNLADHITGVHLTLATLWQVARTDGVTLRFTDHDRDITFGGDTFDAGSGFTRTAIKQRSNLAVDNLNVEGLLDSDKITDADLTAGRYDFAAVEVSIINWNATGDGVIKYRRGNLGEVTIKDDYYEVELRGMTQLFARRVGNVFTPDCRYDLFSPQSEVPFIPGCALLEANFTETSEVDSVTVNRRTFVLPAKQTLQLTLDQVNGERDRILVNPVNGAMTMMPNSPQDGSPLRPWEIGDATDMAAFEAGTLGNNASDYFVLTANIDMSLHGTWTPVVNFGGNFDGRGFEIQELLRDVGGFNAALFDGITALGVFKRVVCRNFQIRSGSSGTWAAFICADNMAGLIEDCVCITEDDNSIGYLENDTNQAAPVAGNMTPTGIVRRCYVSVNQDDQSINFNTTGTNEVITINEGSGDIAVTMVDGVDYSPAALAAEITTKIAASAAVGTYLCSVSADQLTFTLARTDGPTFTLVETGLSLNVQDVFPGGTALTTVGDRTGEISYTGDAVNWGLGSFIGSVVGDVDAGGVITDCVANVEPAGHAEVGAGEVGVTLLLTADIQDEDNAAFANYDKNNDWIWPVDYARLMDPGRFS